ncbi:MAG TPA: methyltransferase domain-containing protein [Acidimicrobiales bacterium]|jgi:SAM-dependent methyltransferase
MTRAVQRFFDDPSHYLNRNAVISLRRDLIGDLLGGHPPRRIVDIGCGDGSLSLPYIRMGTHVSLVDFSSSMIQAAREKVPTGATGRVAFHTLDIETEELATLGPADVVLCVGVLAHVTSPEQLVRRVASLVEPGGRLVLQITDSDRRMGDLSFRIAALAARSRHYSLTRTGLAEVAGWARAAGLTLVAVERYPVSVPGYRFAPQAIQKGLLRYARSAPRLAPLCAETIVLFTRPA